MLGARTHGQMLIRSGSLLRGYQCRSRRRLHHLRQRTRENAGCRSVTPIAQAQTHGFWFSTLIKIDRFNEQPWLLEQAVEGGEARGGDLAYLSDRLAISGLAHTERHVTTLASGHPPSASLDLRLPLMSNVRPLEQGLRDVVAGCQNRWYLLGRFATSARRKLLSTVLSQVCLESSVLACPRC